MEAMLSQETAFHRGPTALRSEGENDGTPREGEFVQRRRRFIVVEREASDVWRNLLNDLAQGPSVGNQRQSRAERLLRTGNQVTPPFAARPKRAAGIARLRAFGSDEIEAIDSERGDLLQKFSRGLRPRKSHEQRERIERRRFPKPPEAQFDLSVADVQDSSFPESAVDETRVECVAALAAEDLQKMDCTWIRTAQRRAGLGCLEENEVHGGSVGASDGRKQPGWRPTSSGITRRLLSVARLGA